MNRQDWDLEIEAKMIDASFNYDVEYDTFVDKWKQLNYPMKEWERLMLQNLFPQKMN